MNYLKIVKIAAGAFLAIVLAEAIGLKYSASAGVITLLSIQDTKKETIRVMWRRLVSFGAALILAFFSFGLFGYRAVAIGIFLLFFAAICSRFQMLEGISVNTVLVTHFLAEKAMTPRLVWNELLLLIIGAGFGVLLNLYIPGKKKNIKLKQQQIEQLMRDILNRMSDALCGRKQGADADQILKLLKEELLAGEKSAFEDMENNLLSETRYYIRYMNMRKNQRTVLQRMNKSIDHLEELPVQAERIAGLLRQISRSFHEYNNAFMLLEELHQVKEGMRSDELPISRPEFENRAVLFQILLDLEQFLVTKREFVEGLSEDEIHEFWETGVCN